jgi:hypothetical protein
VCPLLREGGLFSKMGWECIAVQRLAGLVHLSGFWCALWQGEKAEVY